MSSNKQALIRFHVLDKCFSNTGRKYFIQDLLKACNEKLFEVNPFGDGIQLRQLYSDIKFMESEEGWSVQIDKLKEGKKTYYRYHDPSFSIDKQPLNQAELEQIKSAMQILSRFKGMPQFEWVNELSPKLEQAFLLEKDSDTIISFDNNQYLTGIEHLGGLFHDILYKRPLCIQYKSFKSEVAKENIIHPYHLKQYNNRWFLFGISNDHRKLTNLALDRIVSISPTDIAFVPNTTYNFDEYFEDIIGVTRHEDKEPQKIVLAFDAQTAPYINSKPLHGSQKTISANDKELIISIEVIPNYELESLILSFSDRVKVLEPEEFAFLIGVRLKKAADAYVIASNPTTWKSQNPGSPMPIQKESKKH